MASSSLRRSHSTPPTQASYARTAWHITHPTDALSWLSHIGPNRAAFLLTISIRVEVFVLDSDRFDKYLDGTPWFVLFNALSHVAVGVRELEVYLCSSDGKSEEYPGWRGYGRCMLFARGLARMKVLRALERVVLRGGYPAPWPMWLGEQLGKWVELVCEVEDEEELRTFQEGTEALMPREKEGVGRVGEKGKQVWELQKSNFERFERLVEQACANLDRRQMLTICRSPMELVNEVKRREEEDVRRDNEQEGLQEEESWKRYQEEECEADLDVEVEE